MREGLEGKKMDMYIQRKSLKKLLCIDTAGI